VSPTPVLLIALGGNALIRRGQAGTAGEQLANMKEAMRVIARLARGHRIVITHGNGPQVGNLLRQQESTEEVPHMPLDVIGAMTQGQIGYMLESTLDTALAEEGLDRDFITVLTFTEVDPSDPLLLQATKPIGGYLDEEEARRRSYATARTDKGLRRAVPSPRPVAITQHREIKQLVEDGYIVICCGGGGVPVLREGRRFRGVEAVIDKDLASAKLAEMIGADVFVIATDVEGVALDWGGPGQRLLGRVTLADLKRRLEEGEFPAGSMGPKVDALIRFAEASGKRAVICHLDDIERACQGASGTAVGWKTEDR
jgi:carbamate kinase